MARLPAQSFPFCLLVFTLFWPNSMAQSFLSGSWGYGPEDGPSTWGGFCNNGSQRQSPIDVRTGPRGDVANLTGVPRIHFGNYDTRGQVLVENTGHGVEVSGFSSWLKRPYISGGGLDGKYQLTQFHFHLSQSPNGSEHTINGRHFVAELHIVHIKNNLTSAQALLQPDGLGVISVFYNFSQNHRGNRALRELEEVLPEVVEYDTNSTLYEFSVEPLIPSNSKHFYRYYGSQTFPPCNEAVLWMLMAQPETMSMNQLSLLRAVKGQDSNGTTPAETNVRPVQPVNGRIVEFVGKSK